MSIVISIIVIEIIHIFVKRHMAVASEVLNGGKNVICSLLVKCVRVLDVWLIRHL